MTDLTTYRNHLRIPTGPRGGHRGLEQFRERRAADRGELHAGSPPPAYGLPTAHATRPNPYVPGTAGSLPRHH